MPALHTDRRQENPCPGSITGISLLLKLGHIDIEHPTRRFDETLSRHQRPRSSGAHTTLVNPRWRYGLLRGPIQFELEANG